VSAKILNILILNSSVDEVGLIQQALITGGLQSSCLQVATIEEALNMLATRHLDIVLSDHD